MFCFLTIIISSNPFSYVTTAIINKAIAEEIASRYAAAPLAYKARIKVKL